MQLASVSMLLTCSALALECEPEAVVGGREEGVPVDPLHLPRKY